MRSAVFSICLLLLLPGCINSQDPLFNGRDLQESQTYKFVLGDQNEHSWSLEEQRGKTVVLLFIYTRCDDVCLSISSNVKWVKEQLNTEELEQVSFVSVTLDWRHDSPEVLDNWSDDLGFDWPHLTDWNSESLQLTWEAYDVEPLEEEDESDEGYDIIHVQPTYILDSELKGRVVWDDLDWPVDLFIEDLRTVMALE